MDQSVTRQGDEGTKTPLPFPDVRRDRAWTVAAVAGLAAFVAAILMTMFAYSAAAQIGVGVPQGYYAAVVCGAPPAAGIAGVVLSHWRRLAGHLLALAG